MTGPADRRARRSIRHGSSKWSSAPLVHRLYRVDGGRQKLAVVTVGTGQNDGEGKASAVDDDMMLRARPAATGRVRADRLAPFLAATEDESADARDQSISLRFRGDLGEVASMRSQSLAEFASRTTLRVTHAINAYADAPSLCSAPPERDRVDAVASALPATFHTLRRAVWKWSADQHTGRITLSAQAKAWRSLSMRSIQYYAAKSLALGRNRGDVYSPRSDIMLLHTA